jgi:hypothetical protein
VISSYIAMKSIKYSSKDEDKTFHKEKEEEKEK